MTPAESGLVPALLAAPAADLVGADPGAVRRWIDGATAAALPDADGTLATTRAIAGAAALKPRYRHEIGNPQSAGHRRTHELDLADPHSTPSSTGTETPIGCTGKPRRYRFRTKDQSDGGFSTTILTLSAGSGRGPSGCRKTSVCRQIARCYAGTHSTVGRVVRKPAPSACRPPPPCGAATIRRSACRIRCVSAKFCSRLNSSAPESERVVAEARIVRIPERRPAVARVEKPGSAAKHAQRTGFQGPERVDRSLGAVASLPVRAPFPATPAHRGRRRCLSGCQADQ